MRKFILLAVFGLVSFCLLYSKPLSNVQVLEISAERLAVVERSVSTNETIWHQETFEGVELGVPVPQSDIVRGEWSATDLTATHNWHLNSRDLYRYGDEPGYGWYMGNPEWFTYGGYADMRYIYLQTPEIVVPTENPTLTFHIIWALESHPRMTDPDASFTTPPGSDVEYDGYDGINVRLYTNDGQGWRVITPTSPAYNATSMLGFGTHGNTEMPGWGGLSDGWQQVTIPLNEYAGQSVMIRWVFGSDPAWNTAQDPSRWGVAIDNIKLGIFDHNFDDGDAQGMTVGSLIPEPSVGGQLWKIVEHPQAPSPTHIVRNQNEAGSYNPNMNNHLYSPIFRLPPTGDVRVDFQIRGHMWEPRVQGQMTDHLAWEISVDGGGWFCMARPYGGPRTVFTFREDNPLVNFIWVTEAWDPREPGDHGYIFGDISNYRGREAQFRWIIRSNADNENGDGIFIDDFTIFNTLELHRPTNLVANYVDGNVYLSWEEPEEDELHRPVITGYEIFRLASMASNALETSLGTVGVDNRTFTDHSPLVNTINYYAVRTLYGTDRSANSNIVHIFRPRDSQHLIQQEDGSDKNAIHFNGFALNYFDPTEYVGSNGYRVSHLSVYFYELSPNLQILTVFSERDGMPGTTLFSMEIPRANIVRGWNTFALGTASSLIFEGRGFVAGVRMYPNSSRIGISGNSSDVSFSGVSNVDFEEFTGGVFMIRAYVDTNLGTSSSEPGIVAPSGLTAHNFPNPFNPVTTISFSMPQSGHALVQIYNIRGQLINTLLNEEIGVGTNSVVWRGTDSAGNSMSSGVYFYKIQTATDSIVNKMLLMK